ncbi:MAG: Ig-like domain-containing protein [Candidatus Methylomirabilis sp.]|nr:Ig-like domain-containing protein [Candidatus Methylomirabilis sp.]
MNPPDGAFGVHVSSSVSVTLNKAIDPASITTENFRLSAADTNLAGTISLSGGNTIATFNPDALLPPTTQITVHVDQTVRDLSGNGLIESFTSTFTTGSTLDNVRPFVVSVNPVANQTAVPVNTEITIVFSEPMDPTTLHATTTPVQFYTCIWNVFCPGYQPVVGAYSLSADGLTLTLTPAAPWSPTARTGSR